MQVFRSFPTPAKHWNLLRYACQERGWSGVGCRPILQDHKVPRDLDIYCHLAVVTIDGELCHGKYVQQTMLLEEQIDFRTMERLKRQGALLLRMYEAECAKDPRSHAAEAARSNVIALHHTIEQIHVRGLLSFGTATNSVSQTLARGTWEVRKFLCTLQTDLVRPFLIVNRLLSRL